MPNLLYIDDCEDNLISISNLIQAALPDVGIKTCSNPTKSLGLTIQYQPDVVLIDVIMPKFNGVDLCRQFRAEKSVAHIPIILLTTVDKNPENLTQRLDALADAFLSKPFNINEFIFQFRTMLRIKFAEDKLREKIAETQNELYQSKLAYQHFFEKTPTSNFITRGDGKVLFCNDKFVKLFGHETKEVALKTNANKYYTIAGQRNEFIELLSVWKSIENYEIELQKIDGTPIYLLLTAFATTDETEQITEIQGFLIDITEHKNDKKALEYRKVLDNVLAQIGQNILTGNLQLDNLLYMAYSAVLEIINGCVCVISVKFTNANQQINIPKEIHFDSAEFSFIPPNSPTKIQKNSNLHHSIVTKLNIEPDANILATNLQFNNQSNGIIIVTQIQTNFSHQQIAALKSLIDVLVLGKHYFTMSFGLHKNKQQLETIINSIPNPIFYINPQGIYDGCNDAFSNVIGLPHEKIVGATVYDISPSDLADIYYKADIELIKFKENQVFETKVKYVDNTLHDVLVYKSVYYNQAGNVAGLVGVMLDISERKQNEAILETSKERLEALLSLTQMQNAPSNKITHFTLENAINLTDSYAGFIGFVDENEETLEIVALKLKDKQWQVSNKSSVFNIDSDAIWATSFRTRNVFIQNDSDVFDETENLPYGQSDISRFLCVPVFDGTKIAAILAVVNKIQKYNEDDATQLKLLLESSLQILNKKKNDEEIKIAKEKAEESDRLKSVFLANISHEIRTPLNGIIGFIDFFENPNLSIERRNRYIKIIKRSSSELLKIVMDIVEIAKIESGELEIKIERCSLNEITNLVMEFCNNKINIFDKSNLRIFASMALQNGADFIKTDSIRLHQVLINIADNAIKFTDSGEVSITYEIENEFVVFTIADTGIGIHHDLHEIIFERFRQGDEGHTRKYGGNGLGLAIARAIIELLNGTISIKSSPDNGASFSVRIPHNIAKNELIYKNDKIDLSGLKILVVEDDLISAEYFRIVFSDANADVHFVRLGADALKFVDANKDIDLILMDIWLPDTDGYAVTKKIKEKYPELPIIAQTAHALAADIKKCREVGFIDYISKPIVFESLMEKIKTIM